MRKNYKSVKKKKNKIDKNKIIAEDLNRLKTKFKESKKLKPKRNTVLTIIMSILIACFALGVAFVLFIIISAPDFTTDKLYSKESTIIYDVNGKEFAKLGMEKRELVTYEELPEVLVDAIIATEDSRFFQHNGFDIARFSKAFLGQLIGNSGAGGGSTLTMQVAKNAFSEKETAGIKGIIRKATDIYISIFKLEKSYTKEQIIEFYVNSPWLGNSSWGVEQASQTYFGKSVKDLTLTEAAIIAGMFQAPASYNPFDNAELTAKRRNQVLNLMVRHGYITKEQATEAKSISVESLTTDKKSGSANQGVIDTIIEEVVKRTGHNGYATPLLIYSTIDPAVQKEINKVITGESYTFVNDVVQVGIAVTSSVDGSILAIGAGRNQTGERQYNFATMINRHPGSTAKPFFDYGPLIEYNNASTYTPFFDEEYTYSGGGSIVNADRKYLGLITMRYALAKSRNVPALQAFQQLDPENVKEFVHSVGINYGDNLYESASIGGFEGVSPLTLSAAYGTFARGGYYIEPYSYTKVVVRETEESFVYKPVKTKAMSAETAYMINYMLETAVDLGALGSDINISGTDVAAKTGTSSIDRSATQSKGIPASAIMDSWYDIYSPDYSIAMWYGYKTLTKEYYLTTSAGNKVRDKVARILSTSIFKKNSRFKKPSGVEMVEVEKETFPAQLASAHTPEDLKTQELFKSGTEPIEVSKRFSTLDNPTNLKATITSNAINLSWNAIAIPDAINNTYLQNYFNTYYSTWAEKYYQDRLTYNNNYIGNIGYQVYLKNTTTGTLTSLGFTTNNYYTYQVNNANSNYTFVVKSSYSIFKNNMSSGAEVVASPYSASTVEISINETTTSVNKGTGSYTDESVPFKMYNQGSDVTNYTFTRKYYKSDGITEISNIPLDTVGTYVIKYTITYNSNKYTASRKIIVK